MVPRLVFGPNRMCMRVLRFLLVVLNPAIVSPLPPLKGALCVLLGDFFATGAAGVFALNRKTVPPFCAPTED